VLARLPHEGNAAHATKRAGAPRYTHVRGLERKRPVEALRHESEGTKRPIRADPAAFPSFYLCGPTRRIPRGGYPIRSIPRAQKAVVGQNRKIRSPYSGGVDLVIHE
jgi:hypothetical protein